MLDNLGVKILRQSMFTFCFWSLTHTAAQRCRSDTKKNILVEFFSSVLLQFKKYRHSGNLKFNDLGILQSLKLRIFVEKYPSDFS